MGEMSEIPRKQRSATTSNLEDTIPQGRALPGRRTSFLDQENQASNGGGSRRPSLLFSWRKNKRKSTDFSTTSLAVAQRTNTVNNTRPVYTQGKFDKGFGKMEEEEGIDVKGRMRKCFTCDCSKKCWKHKLYQCLPFINIMKDYSPRDDLFGDVIAGLTVGIMNIPQGMAYAILAEVKPIYGLYVSFFPLILYFFFGGSKHISIGTFAVVSLMAGSAIESQMPICDALLGETAMINGNMSGNVTDGDGGGILSVEDLNPTNESPERSDCRMRIATTLTLLVGLFQVLMGLLRLGFVTIYLADPLISGFTTGAACHVFTSQVKYVLGVKYTRPSGVFKLIKNYIALFSNITTANPAEIIIAATCIITLVLVKECINDRFKSKMKMPVPIDLVVVVLGTLISHFAELNKHFGVLILGNIPIGFPPPSSPLHAEEPVQILTGLLPSAFTIAIIAFAVSVSMSKIFAKKHNYEIDSNQEFLAYGISNAFSCLFSCFPSCASLSRSAVQDNQGGKTQVAGLISGTLVLVVLVAIGQYFSSLPNSVLAAIILVALKGMFKQFLELKRLWYISYYDFAIWLVTWLGVVVLDVDFGLGVGVIFGLLTVVFRTQYPNTTILGRVPHTDLYKDKNIYQTVAEVPGIKVFRIDASLYYANVEHFRKKLYKLTQVNPRTIKVGRAKLEGKAQKEINAKKKEQTARRRKAKRQLGDVDHEAAEGNGHLGPAAYDDQAMPSLEAQLDQVGTEDETFGVIPAKNRQGWPTALAHHIIIDCSMMSYVDSVGVNMLRSVYQEYHDVDVEVYLVNCKSGVRVMFERCSFYEKVPEDNLFLTIHDAVITALAKKQELQEEVAHDTQIVSRPDSMYASGSRNPSLANIHLPLPRRSSQPNPSYHSKQRGSNVGVAHLPTQGEDNELLEADAENNKLEDPSTDPVNGEVNSRQAKHDHNDDLIEIEGENEADNGSAEPPKYADE